MAHTSLQLRLVSGKTANTEEEERMFNTVKSITSSRWAPDHIIGNLFICIQAEEQLRKSRTTVAKQESQVSKLAKSLGLCTNTIIPIPVIKKHARSWQAHLQRIADFLFPGKGICCVRYLVVSERTGQRVLFFITTIQAITKLKSLTFRCVGMNAIWTEDIHGKVTKEATGFLNHEAIGKP